MSLDDAVDAAITAILKPGMTRSGKDKKALKQLVCNASASALADARTLVTEAIEDYDPEPAVLARLKALRSGLTCPKGLKKGGTRRRSSRGGRTQRR